MRHPTLTLGRRLAWAREDAGISVNDMARRLGIHRQTITRYEHGQAPVPEAILLAYQVICDVSDEYIRGNASVTQEVLSSRCMTQLPLWAQGTDWAA